MKKTSSRTAVTLLAATVALAASSPLALAAGTAAKSRDGKEPTAATTTAVVATPPAADAFGPIPSPYESKNVQFIYSDQKIYTLLAQAGQILHVEFAPDEQIVTIQMSDTVRWLATRVENPQIAPRIFFKPTTRDIATTVSIVTTRRKYELLLQTVPEGSYRYQQVTWRYPDIERREEVAVAAKVEAQTTERHRLEAQEISAPLAPNELNWGYDIDGKAAFRPMAVFDDGKFTYLTISPGLQDLPAVFMLDGSRMQIVDYHRQGPYLVIQRLVNGLLLKLDQEEVRVHKRGDASKQKTLFGWFH